MVDTFKRNWWAVGLRGLLSILFGIGALIWPGITLEALIFLFGFYAIADGVFAIVAAITSARKGGRWGWLVFEGILSVASGAIAFVWPGITALALLFLIAGYAFVTGFIQITMAFQIGRGSGWLLGLGGLLSIVFGVLLGLWPGTVLLSLVWLIGYYAIFFGIMLVVMAFQLHKNYNIQVRQFGGGFPV